MCKKLEDSAELTSVLKSFVSDAKNARISVLGNGHINDTYLIEIDDDSSVHRQLVNRFVLQKINSKVFPKPMAVIENFRTISNHIYSVNRRNHVANIHRRSLTSVLSNSGQEYVVSECGEIWRGVNYIEKCRSFENARNNLQLFNAGYAFGEFIEKLSSLEIEVENTIEDFHNTRKRFKDFEVSVLEDKVGRAKGAKTEIEFAMKRESLTTYFLNAQNTNKIPARIVHNDAKIGNLLYDWESDDVLTVIDLDTVMKGFAAYDYGEIIRTSVSNSAEDECDLEEIEVNFDRFRSVTDGFIKGMESIITDSEIETLIYGAKAMTFENGIRFLTDFLNGDIYYKTSKLNQNLDRCRAQFKLLESIECNERELNKITRSYLKRRPNM